MPEIRVECEGAATVPYTKLQPLQGNLKTLSKEAYSKLKNSIVKYGFSFPFFAWKDKEGTLWIEDGHHRQLVIAKMVADENYKCPALPVSYVHAKDKKEAMRKLLALNSRFAKITDDGLYEYMHDAEITMDELDIEFDLPDIDTKRFEAEYFKSDIIEDEVPEAPKVAVTKVGDVWELGQNILLCGDSSTTYDIFPSCGLCFTSPPYLEQRDYKASSGLSWVDLMRGVMANAPRVDYWSDWIVEMQDLGWNKFGWYVWDQGSGLPGDWSGRLAPSHEFIFHFNRVSRKPNKWVMKKEENISVGHGTGLRGRDGKTKGLSSPEASLQSTKIPDSVLRITRHMARGLEMEHPAVFPVELAAFVIKTWSTDELENVFEPFGGSGTTLIAAEQLNRKCYAIEIEPKYCDVIVERWQNLTGQKATRKSA